MRKKDLRTGMFVKRRCGRIFKVIDNHLVSEDTVYSLDEYNDDLTYKYAGKQAVVGSMDIMKVSSGLKYRGIPIRVNDADMEGVLWERQEEPKFKVGDIITGNNNRMYLVSNKDALLKVVDYEDGLMVVKLIASSNPTKQDFIGFSSTVDPKFFHKVTEWK